MSILSGQLFNPNLPEKTFELFSSTYSIKSISAQYKDQNSNVTVSELSWEKICMHIIRSERLNRCKYLPDASSASQTKLRNLLDFNFKYKPTFLLAHLNWVGIVIKSEGYSPC